MTKIDIISGFLGAGKTTLINRLIHEAYPNEKIVLIENEFGEIGIDGGFLQDTGVQIAEMNSGCICCSLVGDFSKALRQVVDEYHPDRILIEPSGVGKLSDVKNAVLEAELKDAEINAATVVVDVNKCKMYMKNFGEFFNDQIVHAGCVLFSHTDKTTEHRLEESLRLVREQNPHATIITTPASLLDIQTLLDAMANKNTLEEELKHAHEQDACPMCGEHHHHYECHHAHEEHEHHHHHECHHDHEEHEHHHHHECHHDHEEHEHHHHHECHHDHEEHEHHHHGHHHADDVFTSWGFETLKKYTPEEIRHILSHLSDEHTFGVILRAKGIVQGENGEWIHFDYIPDEINVRIGSSAPIGKLCVIGSKICEDSLKHLFEEKE